MIITKDMVEFALELAKPSAETILDTAPGLATWGPRWVEGLVKVPGLVRPIRFQFGKITPWDTQWGELRNFAVVAEKKLGVVVRLGMNSSAIVAQMPWMLEDDEYLYSGGATDRGISVAASGAKGWADEAISKIVIDMIIMLAHLDVDRRIANKRMQID